jgi:hypothetical protein
MKPISLDLLAMAILLAIALLLLAFPQGRAAWMRYVLLARTMYAEWPLRLITGRRKPDYARIRQLEIECGLAEPEPARPGSLRLISVPAKVTGRSVRPLGGGITMAELERSWTPLMEDLNRACQGED